MSKKENRLFVFDLCGFGSQADDFFKKAKEQKHLQILRYQSFEEYILSAFVEGIKVPEDILSIRHLIQSHFDETGTRVDKKLWWVHNASNCKYTYLDISQKRGFKGMGQCGVLS